MSGGDGAKVSSETAAVDVDEVNIGTCAQRLITRVTNYILNQSLCSV